MKRRSVEGTHRFIHQVAEQFGIFDLGGLLLDQDWNFTTAVEAFELEPEEQKFSLPYLLSSQGLEAAMCMDGVLAQKLGVPFYIITHVKHTPEIQIHHWAFDPQIGKLRYLDMHNVSENDFIHWWQTRKKTTQTKLYRKDLQQRARDSYFDNLLVDHGLKWGGNIDGFLVTGNGKDCDVAAIIENRVTNKVPIARYDPNAFFSGYGTGDYNTWLPLVNLKNQLQIPLLLMTYSNRDRELDLTGIAQVLDVSRRGLTYLPDGNGRPIRPCDNILRSFPDIRQWLSQHVFDEPLY